SHLEQKPAVPAADVKEPRIPTRLRQMANPAQRSPSSQGEKRKNKCSHPCGRGKIVAVASVEIAVRQRLAKTRRRRLRRNRRRVRVVGRIRRTNRLARRPRIQPDETTFGAFVEIPRARDGKEVSIFQSFVQRSARP